MTAGAARGEYPVDRLLPELAGALRERPAAVVQAAPGAGKTTRVPTALLGCVEGKVLVLEPRRLAARLAAERTAFLLGEPCGGTVGYHVRFERVASPRTRVEFLTEGLFVRLLQGDPLLRGVGCVVLDEFHERHIQTDVALALVRRLQAAARPDLRLVVMSATLDAGRVAAWCGGAPALSCGGELFPVRIDCAGDPPAGRPLERAVRAAVEELWADPACPGHILVFLPGAAEIGRAARELARFAARTGALVLELRAELPVREQQRVFAPTDRRKVILSTNVAETSVTIDGVTGVVDPGLARIPGYATWSGLPTLEVKAVSKASCIQRAGRAGRTGPGRALRLFSKAAWDARPSHAVPELQRLDLAQPMLDLLAVPGGPGGGDGPAIETLEWLDPPPEKMAASCRETLALLGAVDPRDGRITETGRRMAALPVHPRLSRVVVEGGRLGCAAHALLGAAIVGEGMLVRRGGEAGCVHASDVGWQIELFRDARRGRGAPEVDEARAARVERVARQLAAAAGVRFEECLAPHDREALSLAFLAGFPDRVAQVLRRVRATGRGGRGERIELNLCGGGGAILSPASVVRDDELMVAIDAEEDPSARSAAAATQVRVAVGIEPEALVEGGGGFLRETRELAWDDEARRVRGAARLLYGRLVLDERPFDGGEEKAAEVLFEALRRRWPEPFGDDGELRRYAARRRFALDAHPGAPLPDLAGEGFEGFLRGMCAGKRSFAQLEERPLADRVAGALTAEARAFLARAAPEKVVIGAGRSVRVSYEEGKPPWIASRLQDFFGTAKTPEIGGGRARLVVHLLAPSGRPLQVTDDLESFWRGVYPSLRREYARRYPRHAWPEDPLRATPPPPGGRRKR